MQLICFSMMLYPIHAINLNLLTVTGRSDYFLKLEVIKKVWGLAVMGCSLPFGLVAFCAAGIASSIVCLIFNTWYTKKIIGFGFWAQMRDLLPILCNCLVMCVICVTVQLPFDNNWVKIIVGVPVAVIYYVVSSRYCHREQFNEVIELAANKVPYFKIFVK